MTTFHDRYISFTLGFQKEADSLLSVTKLSTISDSENTRKAREMLLKLAEETTIFPAGWQLSERYLFVVVSRCTFFICPDFAFSFCFSVILHPPSGTTGNTTTRGSRWCWHPAPWFPLASSTRANSTFANPHFCLEQQSSFRARWTSGRGRQASFRKGLLTHKLVWCNETIPLA